jgi:uncharacterized membrane protein YkvA (DUF1232 family)
MRDLQRIWQLLRDPAVPGWKWLLPIGALLYWLWPVDLMPFLPFDDIAVVILAISMLLQMATRFSEMNPQNNQGQSDTTGTRNDSAIDTTWRVIK